MSFSDIWVTDTLMCAPQVIFGVYGIWNIVGCTAINLEVVLEAEGLAPCSVVKVPSLETYIKFVLDHVTVAE